MEQTKLTPALSVKELSVSFKQGKQIVDAVKRVSFDLYKGETLALVGESGSGKTSLLMLMSGLENPTTGSIFFGNEDFSKIGEKKKTQIRKKKIGLIFQQFYLIPNYTR